MEYQFFLAFSHGKHGLYSVCQYAHASVFPSLSSPGCLPQSALQCCRSISAALVQIGHVSMVPRQIGSQCVSSVQKTCLSSVIVLYCFILYIYSLFLNPGLASIIIHVLSRQVLGMQAYTKCLSAKTEPIKYISFEMF